MIEKFERTDVLAHCSEYEKNHCVFVSRYFSYLSQHGDRMKFDLNQAAAEAR